MLVYQEMAGAMDVTARGAMEAGERGGGVSRKPIQQVLRAWYETMRLFHKGKAVGEVPRRLGAERRSHRW